MTTPRPASQEYVPIPAGLFGPLMEGLSDLLELRCALRALFLLHRKKGPLRWVTADELLEDPVLRRSAGAAQGHGPAAEPGPTSGAVQRALRACVEHGVLVPFQVEDGGRTTELYVLDTGANRRALARIRAGEAEPPAPTPAPAPERQAARPDLFSLYEANIGAIFPMAAERLKALEEDHPAAWIEDAFREAVRQNRRSLAYIEAILRRWRDEGRGDGEAGRRPGKVTASDIVRRARR